MYSYGIRRDLRVFYGHAAITIDSQKRHTAHLMNKQKVCRIVLSTGESCINLCTVIDTLSCQYDILLQQLREFTDDLIKWTYIPRLSIGLYVVVEKINNFRYRELPTSSYSRDGENTLIVQGLFGTHVSNSASKDGVAKLQKITESINS